VKISARNQLQGTVLAITTGPVNSSVKVDIGGGNVITSMITSEAANELGLKEGGKVHIVIKASDVLLAAD